MIETKLRAAIFDIGATLVTGPPVAPNKVIAALMDGVSPSDISSVIMTNELRSAEYVCEALESRFGSLSDIARSEIIDLWYAQTTAPQPIEGAVEAVLTLKERGFMIGLLSDIWNPYYAGVERCIPEVIEAADAIVLSCRSGCRKPAQDNFQLILHDLNAEPDEAVMIGDTYTHDIHPALELGMKTVWVLARPDREADSIIRVLNGDWPTPTLTVPTIADVTGLEL